MWSERHHSYLKRDSYRSGSSLPLLPQLLAWDHLRLCGLDKGQFKAQNRVGKMLPCWGILLLPFVVIAQAGGCWEGRASHLLPAPSLFLEAYPGVWPGAAGTPPWLCLVCLCGQDLPCGSSEFLPTTWPEPATSVPLSFQTRNRWLLPWMSTMASAPTNLPEPSPSPPDSQVFTAPCVQEENQQGKFGFFDITILSPLCPPSSPAPSWPPSAPPSHLQSYVPVWKALSESGKSVLLRVRKDPDVSVPRPALPCHQL